MTFTILRDAQGKPPRGGPLAVTVTKEPREEYQHSCSCAEVYVVAPESINEMVERGLVLRDQTEKRIAVCDCLGVVKTEILTPIDAIRAIWEAFCVCNSNGGLGGVAQRHLEPAIYAAAKIINRKPHMPVLERPIASWDCESTGVDVTKDRLVQLGVTVLDTDGGRRRWETLINPEMPIPKEASDIHGITDEMVKDAPKFKDIAARFFAGLQGKDFLLYNGRSLDLPLTDSEFRRVGLKLNLAGVRVIDAFSIYQKKNPRTLESFVERYCHRPHRGAHGAQIDSEETLEGWLGALAEHDDLRAMSLDEQAKYSLRDENEPCDFAGKLYRNADGAMCYSFGKHRGCTVESQASFAYWMLDKDFSENTKDVLQAELSRLGL